MNPGFVETPGRRRNTRKSMVSEIDDTETPEPSSADESQKPLFADIVKGDAHTNGYANGHANGKGHANGNGHVNGYANGHANGHANGSANGSAEKAEKAQIKKLDNPAVDTSGKNEFGGPLGMSAMMVGFPALMYYMWIGATYYNGKFPVPAEGQSYGDFFQHLLSLIKTGAYPSNRAWQIYWFFGLVQMAFYMYLPGVYRKGKPLPHLGGKQLDYYCSSLWSFYTSIVIGLALHFTGYFKMYTLIDEFGPIMSVGIISGFLCAFIAYTSALYRGATLRMTGNHIVDFFLGAELNPRLFGILDFKMFLEVRIPWFILFFLALGTCLKQYELYGYVSSNAVFVLLAQWLYANACSKGEHLIITTWYVCHSSEFLYSFRQLIFHPGTCIMRSLASCSSSGTWPVFP